jgi:hypothetical protein
MGRRIEHEELSADLADRLIWQNKHEPSLDLMPTGSVNKPDTTLDARTRQITHEIALARWYDLQPEVGELGAQRRRVLVQSGVGDVSDVLSPVIIAPAQYLAPCAALRVATSADDLERRGDPSPLNVCVAASPFLNVDIEPTGVHRVGAERDISWPRIGGFEDAIAHRLLHCGMARGFRQRREVNDIPHGDALRNLSRIVGDAHKRRGEVEGPRKEQKSEVLLDPPIWCRGKSRCDRFPGGFSY